MTTSPKWDLPIRTMKKLLLLDADIIIDLHSLDLFKRMVKAYEVYVTKTVFTEAVYFKKGGSRFKINIRSSVSIIEEVGLEALKIVQEQAREARLGVDPGETESISHLISTDDITFCSCDKAAIKLIGYMRLEGKSMSLEKALDQAGYRMALYPRHLEKSFRDCVNEGKALRLQFKKLT
jgi:hypothetical protein